MIALVGRDWWPCANVSSNVCLNIVCKNLHTYIINELCVSFCVFVLPVVIQMQK